MSAKPTRSQALTHSITSTQSPIRNPQSPILKPLQLSAARLLLQGHCITAVAAALQIHRYTITRWKKSPAFQAELRRQTDALARHTAQQGATPRHNPNPIPQIKPNQPQSSTISKSHPAQFAPPQPPRNSAQPRATKRNIPPKNYANQTHSSTPSYTLLQLPNPHHNSSPSVSSVFSVAEPSVILEPHKSIRKETRPCRSDPSSYLSSSWPP